MIFLKDEDLLPQIEQFILDAILQNDISILADIELSSIAEMSSYLMSRYDTALIFAPHTEPTPDTRSRLIVMYLVDIVIYHICARIIPKQMPEIRIIRYEQAISWLKKVAKGEIAADLPRLESSDAVVFRWGSQTQKTR